VAPLTSGSVFRYLKHRTKLILLVLGVVAGTTLPLGSFIYFKNRSVLQEKTVEVCKTLALSLANLATEELLMNETYEATLTAILRLGEANIQGLVNAAVFNRDYTVVAELLFLIPNYATALDGYQKSTMAMSEIERVQAKSYCNQGKTKLCLQT